MKKFNLLLLAVLGSVSLFAAKLDQVIVRQQWPWSTDVKIEYKLSGVMAPVDIAVKAYNGDVELDQSKVTSALVGDRYGISEDGVGTIILDPVKAFGTEKVALANFKVKLTVIDSEANMKEVLYKVLDLDSPYGITDITRADLLNGKYGSCETDYARIGKGFSTELSEVLIWTDVTNHIEYMTSKMVLRKINAKDVVWRMGEAELKDGWANAPFYAKLDSDFYIGVFPVTQEQFRKFRAEEGYGAYCTDAGKYPDHLIFPYAGVQYGNVRGEGDSPVSWSYVYRINAKYKTLHIDLPTEAQWEFAARGGNYSRSLYSGVQIDTDRSAQNQVSWNNGTSGSSLHPVNTLAPNAYGLYSILGNVNEWCRGRQFTYPTDTSKDNPQVNPCGSMTGNAFFMMRGGSYTTNPFEISCAFHSAFYNAWADPGPVGVRVCAVVVE